MTYYAKITALAGVASATNWLLTKSPNAYLYGGLMQYSIWNRNAENVAYYRGLMMGALSGLSYSDINSRAGTLTRRAAMPAW